MSGAPYDLLVIGAGPGGYTGAIRAAQLGMRVACVEREEQLGGTCLRVGCIPSKALLESSHRYEMAHEGMAAHGIVLGEVKLDLAAMIKRKSDVVVNLTKGIAGLFKKHKIDRLVGHATLQPPTASGAHRVSIVAADGSKQEVGAKWVMIATGSKEMRLKGVEVDGDLIGTSTEALSYGSVPKHLVVIGAGVIGLEMGSVWRRLGAKVTVLEYLDRILPGMDKELATQAQRVFAKQGLEFKLQSRVTSAKRSGDGCVVEVEGQEPIRCDRVLMATGRVPNTDNLGLDNMGITLNKRGCIPVRERFATSVPGLYAIGDVITGPMLAHKAEEEAVACVEQLATGVSHVNYEVIPLVVYTHPEIASVGKSEEDLKAAGIAYRKGNFPFMANSRARAVGETTGFVKVLAHQETDRVLGVHIMAASAGELITEAVASMAFGASSEDIARVCHPHPTLSEAVKEAALALDGRTINL